MIALPIVILLALGDSFVKASTVGLPWENGGEISSTQYSGDQAQTDFFTDSFNEEKASPTVETQLKRENSDSSTSTQDHFVSNRTSPKSMIEAVASTASPVSTEGKNLKENLSVAAEKHESMLATNLSNSTSHTVKAPESPASNVSFDQSSTLTPFALTSTQNTTKKVSSADADRMTAPQKEVNDAYSPLAHYSEADQAWLSGDSFESETAFDEFSIDPCQFLADQINHHIPVRVSRHMMHEFAVQYDFGHLNDYRYVTIEKQLTTCLTSFDSQTGTFLHQHCELIYTFVTGFCRAQNPPCDQQKFTIAIIHLLRSLVHTHELHPTLLMLQACAEY